MPARVVLVDDHELVRAGIRSLLLEAGYQVIAEGSDGDQVEALDRVADTLGMLGLGVPRRVVQDQRTAMNAIASGQRAEHAFVQRLDGVIPLLVEAVDAALATHDFGVRHVGTPRLVLLAPQRGIAAMVLLDPAPSRKLARSERRTIEIGVVRSDDVRCRKTERGRAHRRLALGVPVRAAAPSGADSMNARKCAPHLSGCAMASSIARQRRPLCAMTGVGGDQRVHWTAGWVSSSLRTSAITCRVRRAGEPR